MCVTRENQLYTQRGKMRATMKEEGFIQKNDCNTKKRIDYPARTISLLGFKGATELYIQQVFDLYYH